MNTESDPNEYYLVNSQSESAESDEKEGIRNLLFDHIYACQSGQVERPGSSRVRSDVVAVVQNVQRTKAAAVSMLVEVNEEKVNLATHQPQLLANLSKNLNSCQNENKQLKNLLLMHLDLIQQQSDQLSGKEKQLVTIREENFMLKKKLAQMDTVMNQPSPLTQLPMPQVVSPPIQPSQQVNIKNFGEFVIDADGDLSKNFITISASDKDSSRYLDRINLSTAIMVSSDVPALGLDLNKQNDDFVTSYVKNLPTTSVIDSGRGSPMNEVYIEEDSTIQAFMSKTDQAFTNLEFTSQNVSSETFQKQTLIKKTSNKQALKNQAFCGQNKDIETKTSNSYMNLPPNNTQTNRPHTRQFTRRASMCIESPTAGQTSKSLAFTNRASSKRGSATRASNRRSSTSKILGSRATANKLSAAQTSTTQMPLFEPSRSSPNLTLEASTSTNRLGSNNKISKIYRSRSSRPPNDDLDTFNDSFENCTFDHKFNNSRKSKMIHTYMSANDGIHTTVLRNEPCYNVPSTSFGATLPYPDPYEITNDPEAMQDYTHIPKLTLHRSQKSGIVTIGSAPPKYQNLKKTRELQLQQELEKKQIDLYNESVIGQHLVSNAINKIKLTLANEPQENHDGIDQSRRKEKVAVEKLKKKPKNKIDVFNKLEIPTAKVGVAVDSGLCSKSDKFDELTNIFSVDKESKSKVELDKFDNPLNPLQRDEKPKTESEVDLKAFEIHSSFLPKEEESDVEPEVELDDFDNLLDLSPLMDEESYSFVASELPSNENDTVIKEQDDIDFRNEEEVDIQFLKEEQDYVDYKKHNDIEFGNEEYNDFEDRNEECDDSEFISKEHDNIEFSIEDQDVCEFQNEKRNDIKCRSEEQDNIKFRNEEQNDIKFGNKETDDCKCRNKEQNNIEFKNQEQMQVSLPETTWRDLSYGRSVTSLTSNIGTYLMPEVEVFRNINNNTTQCIDNQQVQSANSIENDVFTNLHTPITTLTRRAPPRSASMYVSSIEPDFEHDEQASPSTRFSEKINPASKRKRNCATSTTVSALATTMDLVPEQNELNAFPESLMSPNSEASLLPTHKGRCKQTKKARPLLARKTPDEVTIPSCRKSTMRCESTEVLLSEESVPTLPPLMTTEAYYTVDSTWFPSSDDSIDVEESQDPSVNLEVPCWREKNYTSLDCLDGTENLDNAIFKKRHNKHEMTEKRRKRWDMQRIREQRHIEKLLKKRQNDNWVAVSNVHNRYKTKITPKEVKKPHSFWPRLRDIQFIEIVDEIPVSAFGENIPDMTKSEFTLPATLTDKYVRQEVAIQMKNKQREQGRKQLNTKNCNTTDLLTTLPPLDEDKQEQSLALISTFKKIYIKELEVLQPGCASKEKNNHSEVIRLGTTQLGSDDQKSSDNYIEQESIIALETSDTPEKPTKKKPKRSKKKPWTRGKKKNKINWNEPAQKCVNQCEEYSKSSELQENQQIIIPDVNSTHYVEYQPVTSQQIQDTPKSIQDKILQGQEISFNNNDVKIITNDKCFSETKPQVFPKDEPKNQSIKRPKGSSITIEALDAINTEEPQQKKHKKKSPNKNNNLLQNNNNAKGIMPSNLTALKIRIETLKYDKLSHELPDNDGATEPKHMDVIKSSDASTLSATSLLQQQLEKPSLSEEELQKKISSLKASQTNPFANKVSILQQPPKLALTPEEFKQKILMYSENERKPRTKLPMTKQLQKQLQEKNILKNKELEKKTNAIPQALNNNETLDESFATQHFPVTLGQNSIVKYNNNIKVPNLVKETEESLIKADSNFLNLESLHVVTSQYDVAQTNLSQLDVQTNAYVEEESRVVLAQGRPLNNAFLQENMGKKSVLPMPVPQNRNKILQLPRLQTTQQLHCQSSHSAVHSQLWLNNVVLQEQTRPEVPTIFQQALEAQSRQMHSEIIPNQVQDSFRPSAIIPVFSNPIPTFLHQTRQSIDSLHRSRVPAYVESSHYRPHPTIIRPQHGTWNQYHQYDMSPRPVLRQSRWTHPKR